MQIEHRIRRLLNLIEDSKYPDALKIVEAVKKIVEDIKSEDSFDDKGVAIKLSALENLLLSYKKQTDSLTSRNNVLEKEKLEVIQKTTADKEKLIEAINKLRAIIKALNSPPHNFEFFWSFSENPDGDIWVELLDQGGNRTSATVSKEEEALISKIKQAKIGQTVRTRLWDNVKCVVDVMDYFSEEGTTAIVVEIVSDRKIKISAGEGMGERIIYLSGLIPADDLKPGDQVLVARSGLVIAKLKGATGAEDLALLESPNVSWDQIGGLDAEIKEFKKIFDLSYVSTETARLFGFKVPKGVLFIGPPGCGKTMVAQATVTDMAAYLSEKTGREIKGYNILVNGPADILRMYVGRSSGRVKETFAQASAMAREGHLVFIILDEFESLVRVRSGETHDGGVGNQVVAQFNAELNGVEDLRGVFIIGLTNRPDLIDPAVIRPGRFDRQFEIKRPDKEKGKDVFKKHISGIAPIHHKYFDPANYDESGRWYFPTDENGNKRPVKGTNEFQKFDLRMDRNLVIEHYFAEKLMSSCFDPNKKENRLLEVSYEDGGDKIYTFGDFMSGAIIAGIVNKAKEEAILRYEKDPEKLEGLKLKDFYQATDEYFAREFRVPAPLASFINWLEIEGYRSKDVVGFKMLIGKNKSEDKAIVKRHRSMA